MAISAFQKSLGERGDGHAVGGGAGQAREGMASATRPGAPVAAASAAGGASARPVVGTPTRRAREQSRDRHRLLHRARHGHTNFHVVNGCSELRLRKNGGDQGAGARAGDQPRRRSRGVAHETPAKSFLKLRVGAPIKAGRAGAGVRLSPGRGAVLGRQHDARQPSPRSPACATTRATARSPAAVQPGNSGWPGDRRGRPSDGALVVAKLDALAIARITGDIPLNVNFAIKVSTLVTFLDAHKIAYEPADPAARELPVTQRAERAGG
jgi:hypothetical protein